MRSESNRTAPPAANPEITPQITPAITQQITQPIDNRAFAIGVLAVTATVLFVGLLMVVFRPPTALASGQNDRGGDYIMLTAQISNSLEAVVVIDAASRRTCVYSLDAGTKQVKLVQSNMPLDQLPGSREDRENKGGGRRGP